MKILVIVFFLLSTAPTVLAKDFPEPLQVIQEEGQFIFTDGSSYYWLKKDGTFRSEPLGLSGREINGRWKVRDSLFVIEGQWGWINGISPKDDYRRMVLYIGHPESAETVERLSFVNADANVKIYRCYFYVEELQRIPKL